jgi:hypothetical protein
MKWFALTAMSSAALTIGIASASDATQALQFESLLGQTEAIAEVQIAQATTGQFVTVEQDHPTTGTASIVTENGQTYLEFDEAFSTADGPLVRVVLYSEATVPVHIDGDDAEAGSSYVTIAPLQSFDGAQRYLIPADVDLNDYEAVGIWCEQFDVTFGYASL